MRKLDRFESEKLKKFILKPQEKHS